MDIHKHNGIIPNEKWQTIREVLETTAVTPDNTETLRFIHLFSPQIFLYRVANLLCYKLAVKEILFV